MLISYVPGLHCHSGHSHSHLICSLAPGLAVEEVLGNPDFSFGQEILITSGTLHVIGKALDRVAPVTTGCDRVNHVAVLERVEEESGDVECGVGLGGSNALMRRERPDRAPEIKFAISQLLIQDLQFRRRNAGIVGLSFGCGSRELCGSSGGFGKWYRWERVTGENGFDRVDASNYFFQCERVFGVGLRRGNFSEGGSRESHRTPDTGCFDTVRLGCEVVILVDVRAHVDIEEDEESVAEWRRLQKDW